MAAEQAQPGEIVDVRPLEMKLAKARTTTVIKTDRFEVVRLVVHRGREIPLHQAPGDLILQCLEGEVAVATMGKIQRLKAGELVYVPNRVEHSLTARFDSSLLVTMLLGKVE
jgi:quercetin dioxygenase-like cupin family protein